MRPFATRHYLGRRTRKTMPSYRANDFHYDRSLVSPRSIALRASMLLAKSSATHLRTIRFAALPAFLSVKQRVSETNTLCVAITAKLTDE